VRLQVGRGSGYARAVLLAAAFAVLLATTARAAQPATFWTKCPGGEGSGQCHLPIGIAVSAKSGHVYVADQSNNRIDEFSAFGEFVDAWGWGVKDGTAALQTCTSACREGLAGAGSGQFGTGAQGVALDSAGDVYVVDRSNHRVEKFNPGVGLPGEEEAKFLVMFGGDVNKTKVEEGAPEAKRNRCPVDPDDICQGGSTGAGKGQFESWDRGAFIGVGPGGVIYVGDKGRVQKFSEDGEYMGDLLDPEGLLSGEGLQSLAVDPTGNLYLTFTKALFSTSKPEVLKLSGTGKELCRATAKNPRALATDTSGRLYVFDERIFGSPELGPSELRSFGTSCDEVPSSTFTPAGMEASSGLAAASACGIEGVDLYLDNFSFAGAFVRAYGPHPDPKLCPPPKVPPDIDAQYASAVGSQAALVKATIDSHFWETTTYFVEYGAGKCSEGGCRQRAPLSSLSLGGGGGEAKTTPGVSLSGLSADTTYHFRFVAETRFSESESSGAVVGEEATFTTYPPPPRIRRPDPCPNVAFHGGTSASLPDCRAYEMVSPVDKEGGDIVSLGGSVSDEPAHLDQASADGKRLTYSAYRAFGTARSAPFASQYLASRREGIGWESEAISPPRSSSSLYNGVESLDTQYKAFGEDLCSGWVLQDAEPLLGGGATAGYPGLYRREDCGSAAGAYEALTRGKAPAVEPSEFFPHPQGASQDGSCSIFRAAGKLTADAASKKTQLYESCGGAALRLVCILPGGEASGESCSAGTLQSSPTDHRRDSIYHAVSDSGSRIFWTEGESGGEGKLYARVGGAATVELSSEAAHFWTADPGGHEALFTTGNFLGGAASLFSFDVDKALAKEPGAKVLIAEGAVGVMGTSEDLSRIYLASTEVLSGKEANSHGDKAQEGEPNLYFYEAGASPKFTFIATLAGADLNAVRSPVAPDPTNRDSRVTPSGGAAAFLSSARLDGQENTDQNSDEADAEVFLYDAATKGLACVSCNRSGARPAGRMVLTGDLHEKGWTAAQIPAWEYDLHDGRVLSDNGNRLFFESFEPLVLRDTDGTQDVYEWERGGGSQAGCEAIGAELFLAASGGCLSLISSGESPSDSAFVDASADGRDVFFTTAASLVPQDPGLIDIYDAREGGGFPPPAPPKAECEGEACQSPPPSPEYATPGSSSFRGQANPTRKGHKAKKHKHKGKAKHRRHRRHS
jgi:DNA-binding beta-propeller fold protein YncE